MSPYKFFITGCRLFLASLVLLAATGHAEEDDSGSILDDLSELEVFLDETDRFLEESGDPLPELEDFAESPFFWSTSLRAGVGHSSNFLKRQEPISSDYLKAEADFFLNGIFSSASFTTLLYFETTLFEKDADVDQEMVAFLHSNWTEIRASYSFGIEADAFYGDQIYDASLLEESIELSGDSLKQFRPEISLFGELDIGELDSLKVTLSLRRSLIKDEEEDYWRPSVALEWNRVWSGSFGTRTELTLYQELYDDEVAKTATGINRIPGQDLEIEGLQLEEIITWKPVQWEAISASMRLGAAREEDTNDDYDALTRMWASLNGSLELSSTRFNIRGTWQRTRYEDRQVSSLDDRVVRQIYRVLELEVEKDILRNLSLKAGVQWSEFTSRVSEDSFSERRIQALLDWTY